MMNDERLPLSRNKARQFTRIRIDNIDVNPSEVSVDVAARIGDGLGLKFEIEIYRPALCHELQQSGALVEPEDLPAFVARDLFNHPQEALQGYLSVVQGIFHIETKKRIWWKFFSKTELRPPPKWTLTKVENVIDSREKITLVGVATNSANQ